MRAAYRQVLVEELTAAGVQDAMVRSRHEADYQPSEGAPGGSWPLHADSAVPGLPPGVPPGDVLHHQLSRKGCFRNWFLGRYFDDVWEAHATAVLAAGEGEAVRTVGARFGDAGWSAGEAQATADWAGKPLTVAVMTRPGAVAVVTCQAARHARGRGLPIPKGDRRVLTAVAYYDPEPPAA